MENAFFYEVPDWNENIVIVRDKNYNPIGKTTLSNLTPEGRIGVVCSLIAQGKTLKQICTGENWKPSLTHFLSLVKTNSKLNQMFKKAQNMRISVLSEELIELKNSSDENVDKKINNLTKILSVFKNTNPPTPTLNPVLWTKESETREDFI